MKAIDFTNLLARLQELGYSDEIDWQRNLKPCEDANSFAGEAIWVILNSGMKEQVARLIWERIKKAWAEDKPTSAAFNHKGKCAAIDHVVENKYRLFDEYLIADDKIAYLKTIPFIGGITCYHLAKNLGHDVVKPDRHLVRIANQYSTTPDALCEKLAETTGEKKCTIDIVLWRAANLQLI